MINYVNEVLSKTNQAKNCKNAILFFVQREPSGLPLEQLHGGHPEP
jgi:hypothetical protein